MPRRPFSAFTTTQTLQRDGVLSFGPRGSIASAPAGFVSGAIVLAGGGIGLTMRSWGEALMRKGGKDKDAWKADYSLRFLGYTTDNGAYYYYKTEDGKNYEETILDLKAYTVREKVPIRWILYDSWFYAKAGGNATGVQDTVRQERSRGRAWSRGFCRPRLFFFFSFPRPVQRLSTAFAGA